MMTLRVIMSSQPGDKKVEWEAKIPRSEAKKCTMDGQRLMLMGTADKIREAPRESAVFVEDLPDKEQSMAVLGHTTRLVNLVNTCYMNSIELQCLHSVPELRDALRG